MSTAFKQVADSAISVVLTNLNNTGVTTINAQSGQGARFPQPGNGFILTLWNNLQYPGIPYLDPNMEKVTCTARSADVFTITATTHQHFGLTTMALLDVAQNTTDLQTSVNNIENAQLLNWTYVQSFQLVSATRDANEAIISGSIVWPDGATGTFTTDVASTAFPGGVDAYHVTHVAGGITATITQPAVTRDANGAVTSQPALVVS